MAKEGSEAGEMEAAGRSEESILYEKKFKEMQSYIPFLEMIIGRLEQNGDKSLQARLEKIKSLHSILSSTKKKLKLEKLQRCEEVLQKLKAKVDKGTGKEKSASPKQKNVDNKNTVNKSTSSSNKKEDGPSRKKKEPDVQSPASGEKSVNIIMTLAARSKVVPLSGERNTDVKSKGGETKANEIQDSKATEVQDSSDSLADDLDISALIRSRERLKSLLRKQDSLSSPQKSGERLNSPSQWNKNSGASLLDEQELKQISKHIIQRSDSWNRKHSEEESFSSKIRVHSNDLYPEQGGLKSPSMWSPEISSNSFNNINLNSLAAVPLNISSSSLHSPPGSFSHSSGLLSPVRQPQKKTLPVIPPLLNVLQFPPVSGSKPLSEADLEELMEDTINPENDRNAKEPKKKEESKVRSLRAKLEEEIQQVHRLGISKGGALRGLKKVDDIVKSPVRNKGDSKTKVKKDKSPTISENSSGRKSDDAGLLSPSRRSSGNEMKNKSEECVTVKTSERVLDPRKKGDRDDGSVGNAVENRDPRLKSAASLETNTSKDRNVVSVLQDSVKNKGSILSSLSTQDLQKIVEKNLNNLPLAPPELMENLSLNASAINKSSWQQTADMSCLSPREFQHQDVHGSGHYGAHFDPSRATPVPYPRSNTSYNPGYSNIRAEDSPLLKPEDPRLKPRTHIPDPRCNSGRDYQNQGLIPSSPYQDSVLRSPAPHIEGFGSGVLPHPTAHGLRPNGQDLPQPENYGGGLLPPPASHTTRVVGQEFTRSANPYHTSHQLYQGNQTGSIPSQSRWAGTPCYGVPSHSTRRAEENFGIRNTPSNVHPAYTAPAIRHDHGFQFMGQSRPAHETYTVPKQPPWPGPSVHGSTRNPLPVNYPSSGRPIGLSSVQQQQPTTKPGVVDARISCTGSGNIQLPINRAPVSNVSTQNSYSGINSREGKISDRDPRRRNSEDHEKGSSRSKERKVSDSKTTSTRRSVESKRFNERRERESNRRDSTEPNKVKDKETELVSPLNSLYGSTATPRTGKGYGLQKFRIPKIKRDLPKEPSPPPSTLPPSTNEDVEIQAESEIKGEVKEKGKPDCDVRAEAAMDSGAEGKSSDLEPKEEVTQEWIEALIKKSFQCGEAKKCIEQAKLLEKLGESLKGKKLKKIQRILESDSDTNSEEEESNKQVQENTVENKTKASLESHKHKKRSHHRIVISDDESEDDKSKKEKDAPRNEGSDKETAELSETNQNNKLGSDAQGDIPDSTPKGEKPVKRYSKRRSALELLQEDIRERFICEGVTATGHRMCRLLKEAPSDINVDDIVESATRYQDEASTTAGDSDTSSVVSKKHSRKFKDKKFTKKRSETKSTKKSKGKGKPVNDTSNVISAVKEDTLSKAQLSNAEDSSSPVIKSRKKSKWKGHVMESDDSNNDDDDAIPHVEENKDTKESVEKLEDEDIPLQDILLTRTAKAKLLNKYEENNQHSTNFKTECGRRTRLPRVVIEKTDISKIEYTSKPQISYAEETSDEDISSIKDYASSETEFKAKEKSKQSARRGRRRTGGKGRKKAQKHKPNTTIEQNTMQSKFVQETLGTDFLYRKKGKRKRSYFLGKKISDVVERLTLRAQSVRVESAPQESASLESIKPEASKTNIPSDGILKQANEPDEVTEETAYSGMDKISNVKTENVELQDEADVKTTRITLNLIRKTSMQKKTKKKKAKWQLGIINHSKKKNGTRSKFDENKYTGSGKKMTVNDSEVKFETENSAKKELDKQNVKLENEANVTINGSVTKETNIKMNNSEEDTEIQICDSENQNNELISSNVNEIATDVNYTDKGYAFDGSMKYPCKLCPIKCRHIVFHYKTAHADSEVLISRLPELEAEIAIADSKENDYKEVEQEVSKIKIKRRTKKNQRVFCCRICNQICSFAVNFYDHLTSHTGEYRFKCGKCDFKATTRMRVKSHFYSQHPEYKGIESVSTEILAEGPSMDSKYILGYLCSSCNFVQLLRSNLEKHIDLRHNKDAEKAEIICINMSKVKDALERTKGSNESAHTAVEPKQELAKDVQSNSVINSSDRELIVEEDNSTIFDSNNLDAYHSEKMEGSIVNESAIADDVAELKELSQGEDKTTIGDKAVESDLICVGIKSHENECSSKNCTESNIGPENFSNHTESKTPSNHGINIEESADLIGQNMSTNSKIKAEVTDKHCTSTSETIPVTHEKPNEVDEKIFVYPDDVENDDDGKFDQMKRISDNLNGKPSSFPSGCDVLQRLLDSLISENEAASVLEQENNLKEPTIEEEKESPKSETEVVQAVETLLKDMEPEIPSDSNLLNKELGTSPSSVPDKGTETKSKESELNLCALSKRTEENPSLPLEDEEADIVNLSDTNETNANQENNSNILQRILTRDMENKIDSADTKTPKIISVYSKADGESSEIFSDGIEGSENEDDSSYNECIDPQMEKESDLLDEAKTILNTADPLHRMVEIIENLISVLSPEQEAEPKEKNQEDKQDTAMETADYSIKPNFNVMPKALPLIATEAKEIMARRGTIDKVESSTASIRMGPIIVRYIEGNILYSCCLRGCVFATTKQAKFANHLDTIHKNVRWDGKCKGCLDGGFSKHYHKIKLLEALQHVIEHHVPDLANKCKAISAEEHLATTASNNTALATASDKEQQSAFTNNKPAESTLPAAEEEARNIAAAEPPTQLIRIRRLSGDILPATNKNSVGNQELPSSEIGSENSNMVSTEEGTDQTEGGELSIKIANVFSLNPDAIGSGDVDMFNTGDDESSSPERSDSVEMDMSRTPPDVTSPNPGISPIRTASVSNKGLVSPTKAKVLKCTSSYQMCIMPEASLPTSTITVLPTVSKVSSIKVNKLSPVKLANITPKEFSVSGPVSSSFPRSVLSLTRVTQASEIQMARSLLKSKRLNTAAPPLVRVKIADGKKAILPNSMTYLAPTKMSVPASPSFNTSLMEPSLPLSLVTTTVLEPLSNTPLEKTSMLEPSLQSTTLPDSPVLEPSLQTSTLSGSSVLQPSLQSKTTAGSSVPESSSLLDSSSRIAKTKTAHKSAVAPSYAKASKVPLYYQEMLTHTKLRHLFKCMAKQCSYTTDSEKLFKEHFTEHSKSNKGSSVKRNRVPGCKYDWQQCVYCCAMFAFAEKLVEHIVQEHGNCLYQCSYCFFRAICASYIVLHQNTCHINEKVMVLFCNRLQCVPEAVEEEISREERVLPYICQQGSCGEMFYRSDDFQNHLDKEHSQLTIYSCHMCASILFKADRLVAHYKLHSCCYYQCIYCNYGSDTKEEMQHHLCNTHPNKLPKIITRSLDESMAGNELLDPSTRMLDMLKVMDLEEDVSGDLIIHPGVESDEGKENGGASPLISNSQKGALGAEEELTEHLSPLCTDIPVDKEQEKEMDKSGTQLSDNSIQDTVGNKASGDTINEGRTDVNKELTREDILILDENKAVSQTDKACKSKPENNAIIRGEGTQNQDAEVIVLDSSTEDEGPVIQGDLNKKKSEIPELILPEPLVTLKYRNPETRTAIQAAVDALSIPDTIQNETGDDVSVAFSETVSRVESDVDDKCSSQQRPEPCKSSSDAIKTGFSGCALYRCGYSSCTYSAETSSLLKDHLCACDMARDSPSLICVHCRKQYKRVGTLMEHLRTHGTNRFKCSLCDYQAPVPHQVAKHLKQKHRVTSTKVVPLNPLESDPETANFLVVPKERLKGKKPKAMSKEPLDSSNKRVFLPEELEQLPPQAIFTVPLECATCKYETKVRSSLYRHLQLHTLSTDEPITTIAAISAEPTVLPSSAPVNPVPCLETNEMMFDKMTNLALSSHMGNLTKVGDGSSGSENSNMVSTEEGTDQTEGGELSIKIANVFSLNPDAIGSGDVDMFNTGDDESSSPERSDSVEMDMSRTPPDVTSPNPGISPIRTASVSNKGLVSPTKAKVLKCTSSYQMCMMPEASLPTSTITVLPTVSKVSSIKVNKLSPVKLANITPKEFSVSGPVSSSFPRSVLSLTRVTQASEIQMARSLLKSKRLNTAATPLVRVKIADGKKAILPNSMTYLAPTKMSVPASPSFNTSLMEPSLPLSLVTTTVLEPLSNTPLEKTSMLEPSLQSTTLPDSPVLEPSLQTSTLSGSSVLQPSLQSKTTAGSSVPESSSLLDSSSRIAKTKTAHKSAVAPSYAKASKVPLYYQEMLTHTKLRHLFKCMAKQCSYTTDSEKLFKEHFTEHSKSNKGSSVKRNRVPGCKYDWQQCVYCCAMFAFAEKLVEHIVQEHGNCLYQCSYCFFRAICASYIVLHQNTCHINEKVMVLFCNRLQCVPEAVEEEISREERVLPYICQQGNSKMAEDMEAKLPKFVPEKLRYVCGAPNCNYLTVDDTMLRYHLRALHFDQTSYRCPHCPEAQDSNFHIPIERMGAHLKMHDSRLYKCAYCMYNHFQRHVVERHLADKHPEKRPYVHVVREPETEASKVDDTTATLLDSIDAAEATEAVKNPWHCGLCKHQSATRADILDHTWTVHGIKSQYKCGLCTFRSSSRSSVDTHSLAKHPDSTVEMVHVYRKVEAPKVKSPFKNSTSQEGTAIDAHPVWRRDDSKLRHIRGIFLDDEVQTSTPVKQSYKLEENASGGDEKYGQYGEPFGDNFVCPRCLKYRSKYRADFRDHLYRELQYKKWICTHCNLTSCNRNTVMKHSSKVHEKEGKLESIVPLPADEEIEAWVKNVINTQSYIMKHGSSSGLPSAESLSTEPETSFKQKLLDKPDTKEVKKSEEGVLKMDDEKSIDEESISSAQPSSQKEKREGRYECKRCGDKFSLRRGLKLHIRINHLKLGKWMCAYCDYVTNSEIMLSKHSKVRHPELPEKCLPNNRGSTEILDDAFWEHEFGLDSETETSRSAVTQKRKASVREDESSEDGSIKCQECDYSCCSPKDMKQHMIKHWVQKPFKCGYCDFEGVSEYDIKKHSAKMHPMKTFRIIEGSGAGRAEIRHFNKRYKSKASRSDADGSDDEINKDDSNGEEINEEYLMYCCYYCPQRGTAIAVIHQHWEEKHKNGSITSNGIVRCGLPFKYKEVNLRQYIKGEHNAAGRRPSLQCTYCNFRGNYALLEVHHRSMHFDKQFKINRTSSTLYECAVCHFAAFTVNTLKRHFDMEHAGEEFRYIVRTAEEALGSTSSGSSKTLDRSSPLPVSNMEITKYMCLWCEKTYDSELKIQSHHSSHHSSLQLKYSVEKISAPSQIKGNFIPPKRYQCPCCSFSSNNYTCMGEHLRHHVKSFVCGYCKERYESPGKLRLHVQQFHPGCKYKAEYSSDSEAELAVLKSDILIIASDAVSEPVRTPAKRENSGDRLGSTPKKLCVARKSTGSIQGKKLNAVARKPTTYLPWQRSPSTSPSPPSSDPSDVEDNVDQESLNIQ